MMPTISPLIALIAFVILYLRTFESVWSSNIRKYFFTQQECTLERSTDKSKEVFSGQNVIKVFNREGSEKDL